MGRRVRVGLVAGLLGVGGALAAASAAALTGPPGLQNSGVGIYSDMSTAFQMSTFTVNPRMVSCGVGTVGGILPGFTGPFAMLMYSTAITEYHVDTGANTITARGAMRTITHVAGGALAEDQNHTFIAVAIDKPTGPDRWDLHFKTNFWQATNLLCTKSTLVEGGCRFGGDLLMGDIQTS
jgi:hypothetical protein